MTRLQTMRRIVLPQAMRVIIPPTGNETISMLKTTSLVAFIAVVDLLYTAQLIYSVNYKTISAADRGEHLVPRRDLGPVDRPVLPRAVLRPRQRARDGAHPPPADTRRLLAAARRGRAGAGAAEAPGGSPMSDAMVKAESVHKRFGRLEVLKGISLEVAPASVMCLLGPSGSGKSTFLRCINHLEKINAGTAVGRRGAGGIPAAGQQAATSCANRRSSATARRSAWSSSASTSSRT